MRSRGGVFVLAGRAALCAALGAFPVAAAAAPPPADLASKLRRIQETCFDLYPPALVQKMSGRPGPPPDDVRADPRRQVAYLKTEEKVAKGLFYPSILEDLYPALVAAIRPGDRFLDLGSGDGRVIFMAALLGARATGIEYDQELHRIALAAEKRLEGLVDPESAVLRRGDFFKVDLRPYEVYFYSSGGIEDQWSPFLLRPRILQGRPPAREARPRPRPLRPSRPGLSLELRAGVPQGRRL